MNRMIAWFASNHVAANLVMGFSILAGLAAMARIPIQIYPDVDFPIIVITVPYLGAAPEEVATGVCNRIEERVLGIAGIKEVRATAREGLCSVVVRLFPEADATSVQNEVESEINAIESFPAETEKPIVRFVALTSVVMEVAVSGPTDERALKEIAQRVSEDIRSLPGVTQVDLVNSRPYEISVEISEQSLLRHNLTFDHVASALRQRSVDLPGGMVKTEAGEVLLRTRGLAYRGEEIENLVVTARSDGTRVLLRDVARVVDGFEDTSQGLSFDGRPAAIVQISRVGDQSIQDISETVRRYLTQAPSIYPEGIELNLWSDQSVILTDRLGTLIDSGIQGLLMVLIVLALFLRPHLALWVAVGIPIAFLGAIFLLYWFGYAIDAVSVIGFILALGMLVDDAVVVGEAVYVAQRSDRGLLAGAIAGAQQVLVPVTFGVLTTMVAFMPLLLASGLLGQLVSVTAATVTCCLVFSLIECQTVLPAHLGHRSTRMPLGEFGLTFMLAVVIAAFAITPNIRAGAGVAIAGVAAIWAAHRMGGLGKLGVAFAGWQSRFELGLVWFIDNPFRRAVEATMQARHLTLAIAMSALISAIAVAASGHLPFSLSAEVEADRVVARVTMPLGVNAAATQRAVGQLETSARQVREALATEQEASPVRHILAAMGGQPTAGESVSGIAENTGAHLGEVAMQLTPSETRDISTRDIAERWRLAAGAIPGAELSFFTAIEGPGNDIEVRVFGEDLTTLRAFAADVRNALWSYPGVREVYDSHREGKEELRLSIKPAGEALGLTLGDVGRQVRQAFYGEEVQRVQRGAEDIRIMLRYPEERRGSLAAINGLRIRTPGGDAVPFASVVDIDAGRGYSVIERIDGKRSILIGAKVDPAFTTSTEVQAALVESGFLDAAAAKYPGTAYRAEGLELQQEAFGSLIPLFLLAMFGIFALLAIPLRSYLQPLIVMSVLPFAFVGAIWGHLIMWPLDAITGLSMSSVFGVVAAAGVVVNATLVLMHSVNRFRADGDSLHDAVVEACCTRARPIMITTATTFAGVLPLMLSKNAQAVEMVPMTVSLAYGVLFSTVAALLVVPAFWLVMDDLRGGAIRVTGAIGELLGAAPRLTQWMAKYPYIQESMQAREFTDLQIDDELGLDPEMAEVARSGLVRLYYEREFDQREMRAQLEAIAAIAPKVADLEREVRVWAEQRTFQLGVHMLNGTIQPTDAARPATDILNASLGVLLTATKAEFAANNGPMPGSRVALLALGAFGRREFSTGTPLRLLFLFDQDPAPPGLGTDSGDWHAQLLQRLMRGVRELSADGILFEPVPPYALGDAQPMAACSLSQLEEHFDTAAPIADIRMLVNARVIEAEATLGNDFEELRRTILARAPDLAADLPSARRDAAHDPWDVRHRAGGLTELELAADAVKLTTAPRTPSVLAADLASTFDAAAEHDMLAADAARELSRAATLWQNVDGYLNMACAGAFDPAASSPEQRETLAKFANVDRFEAMPDIIAATAARAAEIVDDLLERLRSGA